MVIYNKYNFNRTWFCLLLQRTTSMVNTLTKIFELPRSRDLLYQHRIRVLFFHFRATLMAVHIRSWRDGIFCECHRVNWIIIGWRMKHYSNGYNDAPRQIHTQSISTGLVSTIGSFGNMPRLSVADVWGFANKRTVPTQLLQDPSSNALSRNLQAVLSTSGVGSYDWCRGSITKEANSE
jgi:hypothetical protein